MLSHFIQGVFLGITVAFIIGPVFFTIIQTSIYRGFRSGIYLSFGVMLSDFTLILLSYVGLLELINSESNQFIIGIVGGGLLIVFGLVTLNRKPAVKADSSATTLNIKKPGPITYIIKGYFMNIMNPFIFIFWITVMSVFSTKYNVGRSDILIFFSGALMTIFITDVVKCYIAKKIKRFITELTLLWINRFVGLILIGFGIVLILKVLILKEIS